MLGVSLDLENMHNPLLINLLFMLPFALIGLFVLMKVLFMPMQKPADTSNRIAHLRLVWFAINRPQNFVELYPWLMQDEQDNTKIK